MKHLRKGKGRSIMLRPSVDWPESVAAAPEDAAHSVEIIYSSH